MVFQALMVLEEALESSGNPFNGIWYSSRDANEFQAVIQDKKLRWLTMTGKFIEEIDIRYDGDSIVIPSHLGETKGKFNEDGDTIKFDDGDEWWRLMEKD